MFSIETTWIIPTVLLFVVITMLMVFYIVVSNDFLLDEERAYLQQAGGQVTSSDQEISSVEIEEKNWLVFNKRVLNAEKVWDNPFAKIVGKQKLKTGFTFNKIDIHYLRMGLVIKYGQEWLEKKG